MNVKRPFILTCTIIFGLALVSIWLLFLSGPPALTRAAGNTYTVCPAGPPTCDYSSIQSAVDAAVDGDEIKVAEGIYTGINNRGGLAQVVYIDKSVTIHGGYTTSFSEPPDPVANPTTLDAEGSGRVLFISGNISPTIEGLRIIGGDATVLGSSENGGGIVIQSTMATLRNNYVASNTANSAGGIQLNQTASILTGNTITLNSANDSGGGLSLDESPATLIGNQIISNIALGNEGGGGGGLNLWVCNNATLVGNTFLSNSASYGGGLRIGFSDSTLEGNIISFNTVAGNAGGLVVHDSNATLRHNLIFSNQAMGDSGGGLDIHRSEAILVGNTIISNTANQDGGGLQLFETDITFTNNLIADNQAGHLGSGLSIGASSLSLFHNTISSNHGGEGYGMYLKTNSTVAMTNTIIVSHTVGIFAETASTANLEATLWGSGAWANGTDWDGTGTIITTADLWGNPDFVGYEVGDYHIDSNSDAIDAGVDAGVARDIDRQPRPYQAPDIGADEYWPPGVLKFIYLPLTTR